MSTTSESAPVLTPQQRAALHHEGTSLALIAGAGSGKTTVLTERYLGALEGEAPLPLGRIIALTFTDKAARELRKRVREGCRQRLGSAGIDGPWRHALMHLEAAPIGTFHSFCSSLLQRFAIEAGIEPGARVLDAAVATSLRDEALKRRVRDWLASKDPDFLELAVEWGVSPTRDLLAELIEQRTVADLRAWAARSPEALVQHWESIFRKVELPALIEDVATPLRDAIQALEHQGCDHPKLRERTEALRDQLALLAPDDSLRDVLARALELARITGVPAKAWSDPDAKEAIKTRLERLRKTINAVDKATRWCPESTQEAARIAARCARLAARGLTFLEQARHDRGTLDFDDLLVRARDLLRDPPPAVRSWLQREIGFVLVDEFQDTDPIQDEVLQCLTGADWLKGKLFVVGDVKQSIYRFRGARPELFQGFGDRLSAPGRRALTVNFRSLPEVLDFINALFAEVFPGAEHGLEASDRVHRCPSRVPIEFLWAYDPRWQERGQVTVEDRRRAEARWIARLVRSRIETEHGWTVRDKATGQFRPARPGDVVMLFRTLKDLAPYEAALAEVGLDYHVVGGSAFYGQQEVIDLVNLLSVLEDPDDAVALAGTLRGPFGAVSDNGLFWLAQGRDGDLASGFEDWRNVPHLSDDDRARIGRLHDHVSAWRAEKDRGSIAGLIHRVLVESGFEAAVFGEFLGERRRANLRKIVRMAGRFDAHGGFTLADFVGRLRADVRRPPREEQASTSDEASNAIQLMTIHQAKGLEFPVVIVADLDRGLSPSREAVALDEGLGVVVRDAGAEPEDLGATNPEANLGWSLYRSQERRADEAEAIRLFYVATTRAQDVLVLAASVGPNEAPKSPAMRLLAGRFDRASGQFLAELPEGAEPPRTRVVDLEPDSPPRARSYREHPGLDRIIHDFRRAPLQEAPLDTPIALGGRALDLGPGHGLDARAARTESLVRALLEQPSRWRTATLAASVRDAAERQCPVAPRPIQIDVRDRLAAFARSPLGLAIQGAAQVRANVPWVLAWPPDSPAAVVLSGSIDLLYADEPARWCLVTLAHSTAPGPHVRLRHMGSLLAASALGLGPIERGWIAWLDRAAVQVMPADFDPNVMGPLIQDVLSS